VLTREGDLNFLPCKCDRFCEPEFRTQGCFSLGNMRPRIDLAKARAKRDRKEQQRTKTSMKKAKVTKLSDIFGFLFGLDQRLMSRNKVNLLRDGENSRDGPAIGAQPRKSKCVGGSTLFNN
jgi:hypothetical protein